MNKLIVEFIGTFFLVLTIGCSVLSPAPYVIAPIAIGVVLMAMIYAGGHISGAHFNPAVTLAVWIRGRCPSRDVVPYMVVQVLGAVAAAMAVKLIYGPGSHFVLANVPAALLAEFLFAFALCWVVLNTATAKETSGNSYFGAAIGMVVMAGAFSVGSISGAAFNPAVAIGAVVMNLLSPSDIWIHIGAELAAGAVAAIAFKFVHPTDR